PWKSTRNLPLNESRKGCSCLSPTAAPPPYPHDRSKPTSIRVFARFYQVGNQLGKRKSGLIPLGTFLLSFISTVTTITFGWRKDRRDGRELELKVQELERKLRQQDEDAVKPKDAVKKLNRLAPRCGPPLNSRLQVRPPDAAVTTPT